MAALLIKKVADTNAKISDDEKNLIFQELLNENEVEVEQDINQDIYAVCRQAG